jgi:hypothetical protein
MPRRKCPRSIANVAQGGSVSVGSATDAEYVTLVIANKLAKGLGLMLAGLPSELERCGDCSDGEG